MNRNHILITSAIAMCISLMSGCAANGAPIQTAAVKDVTTAMPATLVPVAQKQIVLITEEAAKQAALNHAQVNAADVTFVKIKLDTDDGISEYEVEFYTDKKEYDYEINAVTGDVISVDYDLEYYNPTINAANPSPSKGTPAPSSANKDQITDSKAKEIALTHAGISESDVTFVRAHLDYDDGRAVYEVEFYQDSTEYDYEIDAVSGSILSYDYDAEHYTPPSAVPGTGESYIGDSAAREKALSHAGVSERDVSRLTVEFEYDDGKAEYEVEFHIGRTEYSYDIDATNGNIIGYDIDND